MFPILKCLNSFNSSSILRSSSCRWVTTLNVEEEKVRKILLKNAFTDSECEFLLNMLKPYLKCASQIDSSLLFWRKMQRSNFTNKDNYENQFKNAFLTKEPRLMLIDEAFLRERIEKLKSLDFVAGSKDLWKLFTIAPAGYFIQDWNEFLRKYYYFTYKILPWIELNPRKKITNPIMKYPEVMELSYNTLKTRFIFAKRTGAKELLKNFEKDLTLKNLLLTQPKVFLSIFAPNCSLEELIALEKLHSSQEGEEDDKLFQDLIDLAPKQNRKDFLQNNLTETYVISDAKYK